MFSKDIFCRIIEKWDYVEKGLWVLDWKCGLYLVDWLIGWCFKPLSKVFQSYHSNSSHYSCLSWVSPELGRGSEVSCPRTLPRKTQRIQWAQTQDPGLRVKHFTTEPRMTPVSIWSVKKVFAYISVRPNV